LNGRVVASALVIVLFVGTAAGYLIGVTRQETTATMTETLVSKSVWTAYSTSTTTSIDFSFTTNFDYYVSINYSGLWNLVYWGENGTVPQNSSIIPGQPPWRYNVKGNLTGSGNYMTTVVTYGVGYVENTLCAQATKLDSLNLTLTLTVVGSTNSTTASNPTAKVCATYAV